MTASAGGQLWQPLSRHQSRAQHQLPSVAHAPDAFGDVAARDGGTGDVGDVVIEFDFGVAVFGLKLFAPTGSPHFIADAFTVFKNFNATYFVS